VASFRVSVSDWLDHLLRADLYVSQSFEGRAPPVIGREIIDALLSRTDVSALSKVRRATVASEQGEIRVTAYELPPAARKGFRFLQGGAERVWSRWREGDVAIVSEPFAYRHELQVGDAVRLNTPSGPVAFEVAGVYSDYGSDQGVLAVSLARFRRHWRDARVHGLGIYPPAGTDHRVLKMEIERLLAQTTNLSVWSNAELKAQSLAVFDRTFTITEVLTVFATLIAALGVFNAMMALHLEREREYAVMQATGCSAAVMRRGLYTQALIVGVLAALFALPVGWGIALLLIEVINVRSFGWTMALHATFPALLLPAMFAIAAAIAASIYPAERVVRIDPAAALRDE
ncbi:MAG: ABC transporter permease, partial [Gammaproteobacteria bacterium]